MWWSRDRWRSLGPAAAAAGLLLALAGCGFQPLHAERSGVAATTALARIAVEPMEGRMGFELRNRLLDRLTPGGAPVDPDYSLRVKIEETRQPLVVQTDTRISRYNLTLDATYRVFDVRQGGEVFAGRARAIGSYNVVESPFATESARMATATRVARTLADDIEAQLAARFGN